MFAVCFSGPLVAEMSLPRLASCHADTAKGTGSRQGRLRPPNATESRGCLKGSKSSSHSAESCVNWDYVGATRFMEPPPYMFASDHGMGGGGVNSPELTFGLQQAIVWRS